MKSIQIGPDALQAIEKFELPEEIGFGKIMAPVMAVCDYKDGKWGELRVEAYGPLQISPVSKVLHYGQEIFEGLKAYKTNSKGPFLFRPDQNAQRFNRSAVRMAMPEIAESTFMEAVKTITALCSSYIPSNSGESLYLRPFMFATEESLGIRPSNQFKFMVLASPSGSYFSADSLKVLIERKTARACPGGTGAAKTGGNYAAGLISAQKVAQLGFMQTLWLDANEQKYIEEMSGMNFFAVIDGKLVTPRLGDTILDGITRKSLIQLAKEEGYEVEERPFEILELTQAIQKDRCTEAFSCGTAAIITPIASLHEESGEVFELSEKSGPVSQKLRQALLDIQEGRRIGPEGWVVEVELPQIEGL